MIFDFTFLFAFSALMLVGAWPATVTHLAMSEFVLEAFLQPPITVEKCPIKRKF